VADIVVTEGCCQAKIELIAQHFHGLHRTCSGTWLCDDFLLFLTYDLCNRIKDPQNWQCEIMKYAQSQSPTDRQKHDS
jgi:hypothetical protein